MSLPFFYIIACTSFPWMLFMWRQENKQHICDISQPPVMYWSGLKVNVRGQLVVMFIGCLCHWAHVTTWPIQNSVSCKFKLVVYARLLMYARLLKWWLREAHQTALISMGISYIYNSFLFWSNYKCRALVTRKQTS